jgi:HD-like signal output (HDOD) protein
MAADAVPQWPSVTRLAPLSHLGPESLREVQRIGLLGELEPGQELFHKGSADQFDFYLIEGAVDLVGSEASDRTVSARGGATLEPVATTRPRPVSARARTRVRFLRVEAGLLEILLQQGDTGGYTVQEYRPDDDDLESRLLFEIYQEYAEDRLEIPAVPELAERIRRAVSDPNNGAAQVARIVQADPAVAARLVRAASSALYANAAPARNLREAIVRLGLTATRDLVISFTVQNLFKPSDPSLRRRLLETWRRSSFVGAVSFTLARHVSGFEPEHALLGGLLHDVGAAMLITHADVWKELKDAPDRLDHVIDRLRGEVGAIVLGHWGLGDDLVMTAREAREWWRKPGAKADVCDVVLVAQLYAYQSSGGPPAGVPELEALPAYRRLGLESVRAERGNCILEDAQKEIAEMRRLLLP